MDALKRQQIARVRTVQMLEENYLRLGKPLFDPKSKAFWAFFTILVDLWHVAYPLEVIEWIDTRKKDLIEEKTLKEQVKSGLHKSYAFPMSLFRLIKGYWPRADLIDPEFARKFKYRFPLFRNSNYT